MIQAIGIGLVGACMLANGPAVDELVRYEFRQIHMGVPFQIALYARDESAANRAANLAFSRIAALDGILSDYKSDSELNRLCRTSGPAGAVAVSDELFFVLSHAQALAVRTDGAFDVTVGPVVKLWRRARRRKQMPDPQRLADALSRVDYRAVRLDAESRTVQLMKPSMRLDLGGIAKGYACDEALVVLRASGITRALIDGGGDLVAAGPPPGRHAWRIKIAPLATDNAASGRTLTLANAAVATSGDAFQSVTIDGTRYSHILNPKTGLGLQRPSSVTVVAPNGITADSLASAVSVLGPQRGLELIESDGRLAALIVEAVDDAPQTWMSANMASWLITQPPGENGTDESGAGHAGSRP